MKNAPIRFLLSGFGCLLVLGSSGNLWAVCICAPKDSNKTSVYSTLSISSIRLTGSTVPLSTLEASRDMWNDACNSANTLDIPQILTSGTGSATIDVTLHPGATDTQICGAEAKGCGCTQVIWPDGSGGIKNGKIHLFEEASNGADCDPLMAETIAHEIGHNLGLKNVEVACFDECAGRIMGKPKAQPSLSVGSLECSVTDQIWSVPNETNAGDQGTGDTCG